MDCEIIWTEPALMELEAVVRHISLDSPQKAEGVRRDILEAVSRLRTFPLIAAIIERGRSKKLREIYCHRIRIIYKYHKRRKQVEILSIWHGSRQEPDFL